MTSKTILAAGAALSAFALPSVEAAAQESIEEVASAFGTRSTPPSRSQAKSLPTSPALRMAEGRKPDVLRLSAALESRVQVIEYDERNHGLRDGWARANMPLTVDTFLEKPGGLGSASFPQSPGQALLRICRIVPR